MYDTLLQLPLFQGLSKEDLTNILAKVKLHFLRFKDDEVILEASTTCDLFMFIIKGAISATTISPDGSYEVTEFVHAPCLLEPQSMFGMNTQFVSTYTAQTEVQAVSIDKDFVVKELLKYDIFRLNYINQIGYRAQLLAAKLWSSERLSVEGRIVHFLQMHTERNVGRKELKVKMERLAHIVNDTRLSVSRALNDMQSRGLLRLSRGEIVIPDMALLLRNSRE